MCAEGNERKERQERAPRPLFRRQGSGRASPGGVAHAEPEAAGREPCGPRGERPGAGEARWCVRGSPGSAGRAPRRWSGRGDGGRGGTGRGGGRSPWPAWALCPLFWRECDSTDELCPERRRGDRSTVAVRGCQSRGGGGWRKAGSGRPEEGPHPYLALPKPSRNGHLLNEASECPSQPSASHRAPACGRLSLESHQLGQMHRGGGSVSVTQLQ